MKNEFKSRPVPVTEISPAAIHCAYFTTDASFFARAVDAPFALFLIRLTSGGTPQTVSADVFGRVEPSGGGGGVICASASVSALMSLMTSPTRQSISAARC